MKNVTTLKQLQNRHEIVQSFQDRPLALQHYVEEALDLIDDDINTAHYLEVLALMMRCYRGILSQRMTKEQYKFLLKNSRSYEFLMR